MRRLVFKVVLVILIIGGVSACGSKQFKAGLVLPGRWEGLNSKGKSVVLVFKANQEVVLMHDQAILQSVPGQHKVIYQTDQSKEPNILTLQIQSYATQAVKPRVLRLIFKLLSADTMLIAIGADHQKLPASFDQIPETDKTILVKQPPPQ